MPIIVMALVVVVFLAEYIRKKRSEKLYDELTLKTDAEEPKKKPSVNVIADYQYLLFDQFVKSTWPVNFLSWEALEGDVITAQFEACHRIIIRHTDGTYHTELIYIERNESSGYGLTYNIYAKERATSSQTVKNTEEKKTANSKPEDPHPQKSEEKLTAAKWAEDNLSWMKGMIKKGNFLIRFGNGEHEIPESIKDDALMAIDDLGLFQVQQENDGIAVFPIPEF